MGAKVIQINRSTSKREEKKVPPPLRAVAPTSRVSHGGAKRCAAASHEGCPRVRRFCKEKVLNFNTSEVGVLETQRRGVGTMAAVGEA